MSDPKYTDEFKKKVIDDTLAHFCVGEKIVGCFLFEGGDKLSSPVLLGEWSPHVAGMREEILKEIKEILEIPEESESKCHKLPIGGISVNVSRLTLKSEENVMFLVSLDSSTGDPDDRLTQFHDKILPRLSRLLDR